MKPIVITMTKKQFSSFFKKQPEQDSQPGTFCALCMTDDHSTQQCSVYRTRICTHFSKGCCRFGERCSFAHQDTQIRNTR